MKTDRIVEYMDELFPNPKCELHYTKDYELLLAVMLSAQTTDKRVNMVTSVLFDRYPSLEALDSADLDDIVSIIRPIGTFSKKAMNIKGIVRRLLLEKDGCVPNDREYLESLPGVGRKTTNVVLNNLFGVPCIAVDTHVTRVSKRLGLVYMNDDVLTIERKLNKKFSLEQLGRLHHQFVLFGRYYCKASRPECKNCKLYDICKEKKKTE